MSRVEEEWRSRLSTGAFIYLRCLGGGHCCTELVKVDGVFSDVVGSLSHIWSITCQTHHLDQ